MMMNGNKVILDRLNEGPRQGVIKNKNMMSKLTTYQALRQQDMNGTD